MASHLIPTAAALLATIAPAHAGGFGIPEIGLRRTAMGSIIGRPDDASAIYHNPAGLILQHGRRIYLAMGLSLVDTEFRLRPWADSDRFLGVTPEGDGYYAPVTPSRAMGVIPMIAATVEVIPDRLVVGSALFVGNATGGAFEKEGVTRYHLVDGYIVAPQAVISAAYRVHPTISVGASAGLVNIRVHIEREVYPILNGMDVSAITGTHPVLELDGSDYAPTWMIGAFGQPHPRITWGATITGRVDAELEGPIEVLFSDDAGTPGDTLIGTQTTNQLLPWAFMAGVNFDVTPNLEIAAEYRHWLYRQYQQQTTTIKGIALVNKLETMKNYEDSWQLSGGLRLHSLRAVPALELMLGTHRDESPAPPQTITLDQPTFDHWGLHSGARWQAGRYRIGASYIHYWYAIPTITDSITGPPSNIRGRGSNNIFTLSLEASL